MQYANRITYKVTLTYVNGMTYKAHIDPVNNKYDVIVLTRLSDDSGFISH